MLESKHNNIQAHQTGRDMTPKDQTEYRRRGEMPLAQKQSKAITAKNMFNRIIIVAELLSKSDLAQNEVSRMSRASTQDG